jgi:hypothetical protein
MKFLILSENSNGTWPYLHFRGMGPFEIRRRLEQRNIPSTIIEWFTHWDNEINLRIVLARGLTRKNILSLLLAHRFILETFIKFEMYYFGQENNIQN